METINGRIEDLLVDTSNLIYIYPSFFYHTFSVQSKGNFEYSIFDSVGNEVEKGSALGDAYLGERLRTGLYLLQVKNDHTSKFMKMVKR